MVIIMLHAHALVLADYLRARHSQRSSTFKSAAVLSTALATTAVAIFCGFGAADAGMTANRGAPGDASLEPTAFRADFSYASLLPHQTPDLVP